MVTLDRGNYRIAVMNLKTRALRVLSSSNQDESPSYAPNGVTLIYGTQDGGRGALATGVVGRTVTAAAQRRPQRAA